MAGRIASDDGFTLVELLVTISILSVVMALMTGSAIFLQRSVNETDQRFDDLGQTRIAMDATSKWLRSAITVDRTGTTTEDTQPFLQASRSVADLMANVGIGAGAAPRRIRLDIVNGDELREQIWTGSVNGSGEWQQGALASSRIIARGLTGTWLFTWFDADGAELTPAGAANLSTADREAVRRVGVDIAVQQAPNVDVPPSQLTNRVTLPNQYYFDAEGGS